MDSTRVWQALAFTCTRDPVRIPQEGGSVFCVAEGTLLREWVWMAANDDPGQHIGARNFAAFRTRGYVLHRKEDGLNPVIQGSKRAGSFAVQSIFLVQSPTTLE